MENDPNAIALFWVALSVEFLYRKGIPAVCPFEPADIRSALWQQPTISE
jgi:hypothetical protein